MHGGEPSWGTLESALDELGIGGVLDSRFTLLTTFGQGDEVLHGDLYCGGFVHALAKELIDFWFDMDCRVDERVTSRPVCPDGNEVLMVLMDREESSNGLHGVLVLRGGYGGHQSANTAQHVNGRVVSLGGQFTGEHHMAIQETANGIANGLIGVISLDQDIVEAGNASFGGQASPFS